MAVLADFTDKGVISLFPMVFSEALFLEALFPNASFPEAFKFLPSRGKWQTQGCHGRKPEVHPPPCLALHLTTRDGVEES